MNKLTKESNIMISKCLFSNEENASNDVYMFYETCLKGSAKTTYSDNYMTGNLAEIGRSGISMKKVGLSQKELFVNPLEGDLTINKASIVYTNRIGDPRWLK